MISLQNGNIYVIKVNYADGLGEHSPNQVLGEIMSHLKVSTAAAALLALSAAAVSAQSLGNVQAAGSSTVLPYANILAEAFGAETDFATPVVDGGSSTGRRTLCEGVGEGIIDISPATTVVCWSKDT